MELSVLIRKSIAILWFWKEGQSTLAFLQNLWAQNVTVLDKDSVDLESSDIAVISGESYLDSLDDFDVIFKSPGICPFSEKIVDHRTKLISQTQVFFENYTWKVIWITGTKGKSTVSTLLYQCLKKAGYNVKLVGNIWSPVLEEIDITSTTEYDYVIYEMSSYMLQDFIPRLHIGFFNNIYPCHLDWHGDWDTYKKAKLNILEKAEFKLVNAEFSNDEDIKNIQWKKILFNSEGKYRYKEEWFFIDDEFVYPNDDIALAGEHNRKNIAGVLAILDIIMQDSLKLKSVFTEVLPSFSGLPNRIEDIGTYEGIRFINDSIATTPESTIAAIQTFWFSLQTLFLWWEDSGFQFKEIRNEILHSSIQNIIAFPDTSEKIFPEIAMRDYEKPFEIEIEWRIFQILKTRHMKSGVDFAYKTTFPAKIALLSCAAPSFSLWPSYLIKAEEFRKYVENY